MTKQQHKKLVLIRLVIAIVMIATMLFVLFLTGENPDNISKDGLWRLAVVVYASGFTVSIAVFYILLASIAQALPNRKYQTAIWTDFTIAVAMILLFLLISNSSTATA